MEILWIEIRFKNVKILVSTIYRPPNSGIDWWDNLQVILNEILESDTYKYIVLTGDLNAHLYSHDGTKLLDFYQTITYTTM